MYIYTMISITPELQRLINEGALVVINDSGGKDSQCMKIQLAKSIPAEQLVIIHAHLPGVEWDGVIGHIENNSMGIPVHVCKAVKTFFQMVEHRQKFPSPSTRQCTSDLKRGPIEKFIKKYMKDNGFTTVINCMGLRAEESAAREKKIAFKHIPTKSIAGRQWYDWLPIHQFTIEQVWQTIAGAGQVPHWAYSKGMSRLSCCFCIMANKNDLRIAAKLNPELYNKYVETEERLNFTLLPTVKGKQVFLKDIVENS